jgi:hypothetical protein
MARIGSFRESGERYPVLRALAKICHWIGILLLTLSALLILGGIGALLVESVRPFPGWYVLWFAFIWSLGLFAAGIQSLAIGSFFRLAIHVEENTRATAQALDRLRSSQEPKPEVDALSMFLS